MNLDTRKYLQRLEKPNNPLVQGWNITPTTAIERWRCVHVHECTQEEAPGDHNVWVDVIDRNGQRIAHPAVKLYFGWTGSAQQETIFEKPEWEPGANFTLSRGEDAWCSVGSGGDIVNGLYGRTGHSSYYVVFQQQTAGDAVVTPPHQPGMVAVPLGAILEVERLLKELTAAVDKLR